MRMTRQGGLRRRIAAIATGAALLAGSGIIVVAAPAAAATAPNCVWAQEYSSGHIYVRNNCKTAKRIKVIIAWGQDQSCTTLKAGHDKLYLNPPGWFDRVDLC